MSESLKKWGNENLFPISKSFCAAKWYNAGLFLNQGYTNSCHLPLPHPIDPEKLKDSPSVLHNTDHKKQMRKMMLEGKRPAECSYCWKLEDIGRNDVSDRVYKSMIYSPEDISALKDVKWDDDVLLKTLEVTFDRVCNFACSYCNASYSTTWSKDINTNGPYQKFKSNSSGTYQSNGSWADKYLHDNENNPYINAFLEWWPELSKSLFEIRITGGEPTMSPNFWNFIETLKKYPSDKMRLSVNSNLGMNEDILKKLIDVTHQLEIKEFDLYTSNESFGKHAEYIRDGLDYKKWKKNMTTFIENAKFRSVSMMMTITNLSLFSITEFLDDMLELKEKYATNRPILDLNILRWPTFMSPVNLPDGIKMEQRGKLMKWYEENRYCGLLISAENEQIERLIDYLDVIKKGHVTSEDDKVLLFHDFKSFYTQYDKRRNKNFVETFPELSEWYNSIKIDQSIPDVTVNDGRITHYETGEYITEKSKLI